MEATSMVVICTLTIQILGPPCSEELDERHAEASCVLFNCGAKEKHQGYVKSNADDVVHG